MTWSVADTDRSIPECFEEVARRHPAKLAIGGTAWKPSFGELDAAANRIAGEVLERLGGGAGTVALLMRHDAPQIAAALGGMRAGGTVVALNPRDPPARLEQIRADVEPGLVLCDQDHRELALRAGFSSAELGLVPERPEPGPHRAPDVTIDPDRVAVLVYTSGSTGGPKGVMQTHRNLLHNVLRQTNGLGVHADDRIILLASLSGAQGVATTWIGLLNGATVCPFPTMERGVTGLTAWLADNGITVLIASASVFRGFARTLGGRCLPTIRLLRLASEPATRGDFEAYRRHFEPTCVLASTYSSSETGNITQLLLGADSDPPGDRLPVGRPAEGIEIRLLDEQDAAVAPGGTGEVVVRSEYLSPGYWRDDALTAERFGRAGSGGPGYFRTGDLGRLSGDGVLTLVGRTDTQVKVRGNRVELSEVEAAIAARPEIAAAAVHPGTTARGDGRLTAYVTARPGAGITAEELRSELAAALPGHSVPAAFAFVDELPLNPNGGVDRDRLAQIEARTAPPGSQMGPKGKTERLVAGIWSAALELESGPAVDDDFFALGGDSLSAAVIAAELYARLGVELELRAFVESPTVAEMAELVDRLRVDAPADDRPPLVRSAGVEPPASFQQERTWRACRTPEGAAPYTVAVAVAIRGPLDLAAMRRSIEYIVRRHEVLRTTFAERGGRLVQIVKPAGPLDMPVIDVSGAADPEAEADELLASESRIPFDLERGPLLRLRVVRTGEDEHRLLRINHHINSDAWSWQIFFEELIVLYEAYREGRAPPLPAELPLQYGDFALWERRFVEGRSGRYREEIEWWRRELADQPPAPPLPFARPAPREDAVPADGVIVWGLPPETSRGLARVGRQARATFFVSRLALFAAQVALDTGQEDLLLATHVSRRRRTELQGMFGPLLDGATLRLRFAGRLSFREWLVRVRAAVVEMSAHTEIPYEELLDRLDAEGVKRPQIVGVFGESHQQPPLRFGGIEVTHLRPAIEYMPWGFSFWVHRSLESDQCRASFDARLHDPVAVRAFVGRYQSLAAAVAADPDRPLRGLRGG